MSHTSARHRRQSQRTRRATPRVEQLEHRWLLSGYNFTPVAILGNPAPGLQGGTFADDFEAGGLNNSGQVAFVADLAASQGNKIGEGVFLGGQGGLSQVIRAGEPAPGGGTFLSSEELGAFSPIAINNSGAVAFAFLLDPFTPPYGNNAGVYRSNPVTQQVTAVVVPGVTPVPGGAPGATFAGAFFWTYLNDTGTMTFTGTVPATVGFEAPLGQGVFEAAPDGQLSKIVAPGDTVANIGTFDQANEASNNSKGDVAFAGHLTSDPSTIPVGFTSGVYLQQAPKGQIISIAHHGDPIPATAGGGVLDYAFGPIVNDSGRVAFVGAVQNTTSPPFQQDTQLVFLYSRGSLTAVASPGQPMPGGGHLVTASAFEGQADLNNGGAVVFSALLDTGEEGLYVYAHGSLSLVAKTGTVIPGVGTIAALDFFNLGEPSSFARINNRGQVAFGATLVGGGGALLLATPGGTGNSDVAAVSSALTAPTPAANGVATSLLVSGGQSTSRQAGTNTASRGANSGSVFTGWTVEVRPQQVTTSLATAPSRWGKRPTRAPIDDLFVTLPSGLSGDPLA